MNFPNLISKNSQKIDRVSHKIKQLKKDIFLSMCKLPEKKKNNILLMLRNINVINVRRCTIFCKK